MNPYVLTIPPYIAAGRKKYFLKKNVESHADIPAFCYTDTYCDQDDNLIGGLQAMFPKSDEMCHCEISFCLNPDEEGFDFMLGRGVFDEGEKKSIPAEFETVPVGGLYAVFSTELTPFEDDDMYVRAIKDTWMEAAQWIRHSGFRKDPNRLEFEFYDRRDHGQYFQNRRQMDICIPIEQTEEDLQAALENGNLYYDGK